MRAGLLALSFASLAICFGAGSANARSLRIDFTINLCDLATEVGPVSDSVSRPLYIVGGPADPAPPPACPQTSPGWVPFNINYYGTSYNGVHVGENGIIVPTNLPSPLQNPATLPTGTAPAVGTDLFDLTTPAIAPLFADLPDPVISYGFGFRGVGESFFLTYRFGRDPVTDRENAFQVEFNRVGSNGDFDLVFYYDDLFLPLTAQAGFTDGEGGGYLFPGSGVPGAFVGQDAPINPADFFCQATSLVCNSFGVPPPLPGEGGIYRFAFRNGVPVNLQPVPAPGAALLLALASLTLGTFRWRRR